MQLTEQQAQMMQQEAMQQQQRIQLDLSIMQMKMSLLALAKDIKKENSGMYRDPLEVYYILREEVLGIPVPVAETKPQEEVK